MTAHDGWSVSVFQLGSWRPRQGHLEFSDFRIIESIKAMATDMNISAQEFRVWVVLALSAGVKGDSWKSVATIAKDAATSKRTTERVLRSLCERCHIQRSRRGRTSSLTILPWSNEWQSARNGGSGRPPKATSVADDDPPFQADDAPPLLADKKKREKEKLKRTDLPKENNIQNYSRPSSLQMYSATRPASGQVHVVSEEDAEWLRKIHNVDPLELEFTIKAQ